jgi:AcrR family transcriptional regulator
MAFPAMKKGVSEFKKALVLRAACKLFSERGYAATTINAITAELSTSRRAVYDHFSGKSEMLVAICEQAIRFSVELAQQVEQTPGDPVTKLRRLAHDFAAIVLDNQDYIAIAAAEMKYLPTVSRNRIRRMQEKFDRLLHAILADGVARGVFDTPDAAMTGLAVSGMIIWAHRWYRADGRLSAEQVADALAETALRMARSPGAGRDLRRSRKGLIADHPRLAD